jgi:glycosyltransferase involved in cell wall biosynthesis
VNSLSEFDHYLPWTPKRISKLDHHFIESLLSPISQCKQDQSELLVNLMVFLANKANENFDINTFLGRSNLLKWYKDVAFWQFNLSSFFDCLSSKTKKTSPKNISGINLIGYSRSPIGLGEDIRNIASVLKCNNISFCILNIGHPSGNNIFNASLEYVDRPQYNHSLFCMNPIEFGKLLENSTEFHDIYGYVIGMLPWELPRIPEAFIPTISHLDEVWAISHFNESAFLSVTNSPVIYMPPIVSGEMPVSVVKKKTRQKRKFTFLYIFDASSYLSRKNPIQLVRSFIEAFNNNEPVRLIIKVSNIACASGWDDIKNLVEKDKRIFIDHKLKSDTEMKLLIMNCDCYISLHRSEGFGRTIAEAALIAKPVIATDWSGSLDIIGADNLLAVKSEQVNVKQDEYPYGEGQHWANPVDEDVIKRMKEVFYMSQADRAKVGMYNKKHVFEHFSAEIAGEKLLSRLNELGVC